MTMMMSTIIPPMTPPTIAPVLLPPPSPELLHGNTCTYCKIRNFMIKNHCGATILAFIVEL